MKKYLLLLLTLASCTTTKPTWMPVPGDRVVTNYCPVCPDSVGKPQVITVTSVFIGPVDTYIYSEELQYSVPLSSVTKWE